MYSRAVISMLVALMLISCAGKKSEKLAVNAIINKVFVVNGDPENIIKGSTLNKNSFITKENVEKFNNFSLVRLTQFKEKEGITIRPENTPVNIEAGQEAEESSQIDSIEKTNYNFKLLENGHQFLYSSSIISFSLLFNVSESGQLDLIKVLSENEEYPTTVFHYSLHKSENSFSLLFKVQDGENGNNLVSIVFAKKRTQTLVEKISSSFKYIMGAGLLVGWNQANQLNISLCGIKSYSPYSYAYMEWIKILKNHLKTSMNLLVDYPPFSDLNTHCIYEVDDFLTTHDQAMANPAATVVVVDPYSAEIVDSDIFIWLKENEKISSDYANTFQFYRTITHEFGHFLGLDHQFDSSVSSIMSYNPNDQEITDYDKEALLNIYKKNI